MSKTQVTTVLVVVVLLHAVLAKEHGPAHRRFSHVNGAGHFAFPRMLSERDECTDINGEGSTLSYCPPSSTACCVFNGESFPSCQQFLGKGWCCAGQGEGDKCYVDQESVCEEDNSVACTRLPKGTSKACCPKLTTCDPDQLAEVDSVRCLINWTDLVVADAAQKSKDAQNPTSTSATSSSTSTDSLSTSTDSSSISTDGSSTSATSSSTSTTSSVVPTTSSDSNESTGSEKSPAGEDKSDSAGVSGGAIAGAVVGGLASLALIGAAVFFILRRRKEAKYKAANQVQPASRRLSSEMTANVVAFPPKSPSPHDPGNAYTPPPPVEVDSRHVFVELDSTREPQQLDSTSVIAQLDSTAPQLDLTSPQREPDTMRMDPASHQREWAVSQSSLTSSPQSSSTSQLGPANIPWELTVSQLERATKPQQQNPQP